MNSALQTKQGATSSVARKEKGTPFFQPKFSINQPNDAYEQEADAVADKVMRMPEKKGQKQTFFKPLISTVQRKCKECEEEEKLQRKQNLEDEDSLLQRKAFNHSLIQKKCAACEEEDRQMQRKSSGSVPQATSAVYQALQTKGQSLDSGTKSFMESRFGYDFKDVQIHNDSLAHQSSAEINALAYTQGKHVVFGANQYQPHTDGGKKLLAHELTHVVQQGASLSLNNKVNRKPDEEGPALTRYQEIEQSIDSPGAFEVLEQPFGISVYNFAINRYALKAEHKTALKKIGNMLASAKDNSLSVLIMGNTDSTGGPIINNPLSVNRAKIVRNYLADVTGRKYAIEGEGQYMPVETNEIVSGRTRNRRVDIVITHPSIQTKPNPTGLILPPPYVYKAPIKIEREEWISKEKKKTEDCPWPWSCIDIPWIWPWFPIPHCVKLFIECDEGANPDACYDFYEDCIKTEDEKKKRACPEKVDLPEGNLPLHENWPFLLLKESFWMLIDFKDDKDNGCYCECGEYLQNVRGFFEIEYRDGRIERIRKKLTPGIELEENTFHEDGDGTADSEYGHRSHAGRLTNNSRSFFVDKFFPGQKDGCSYIGMDQPGIGIGIAQHDEVRRTWFLEFEGMPVDNCAQVGTRTPMEQYKKTWRIQGEIIRPPEPKVPVTPTTPSVPKAPGNGGSGGNSKLVPVTPTKAKTHPSHSMPSSIEGINPNAKVGHEFDMTILFNVPGKSETYSSTVHVTVVEPTNDDFITIVTSNDDDLNLAPQGESEIVLQAHKKIKIMRSYLQ